MFFFPFEEAQDEHDERQAAEDVEVKLLEVEGQERTVGDAGAFAGREQVDGAGGNERAGEQANENVGDGGAFGMAFFVHHSKEPKQDNG